VRHASPARLALAGVALAGLVAVVLWLAPSNDYIFLPDAAHPVAPLVMVAGGHDPRDGGGIFFVDILVRRATLLEKLFPGLRPGSRVVPASEVTPPGVSDAARHRQDLQEMGRSQQIAAAVALRTAGYKVDARPNGVLVDLVSSHGGAAGKLDGGDVILAVDGKAVRTPGDLRRALGRRPPGTSFELTVRRGRGLRQVRAATRPSPRRGGRPVLGILVEQNAQIRLPVNVKISAGGIGGPSAGLAFALDILEELGRDVDHGHRIAATGQIELDGSVVPIGGIEQKAIGVERAGVDVFLVPAGENAVDARRYVHGVRIVPVSTFQQALRTLATLPKN